MESSILVTLSRQGALRRDLDVVANNLANMNTTAFKAERMMLVDHPVPAPGVRDPRGQPLMFVRDVATVRDLADGGLEETGADLDVAISGDGYLVVDTPLGPRYTRNGHLRLDGTGQLVTDHGLPVLTREGTPVAVALEDGRIGIGRDGSIITDAGVRGSLRVVRFEQPQAMQMIEGGLLSSEETPQDVPAPMLMQGMLERSNVQPILEMKRLIEVQRAYDQARGLIDREDDRLRKMMQVYVG